MTWAPWSVIWVNFDPTEGHEQAGRRPAIIVASVMGERVGARSGLTLVVPCTTRDRNLPWHVPVALKESSFAQCEQVRAISTSRIYGPYNWQRLLPVVERDAVRAML